MGWGLLGWFVMINALAYLTYAADKKRAIAGGNRISEQRLLVLAALGGSIGAIVAQQMLRHKTRKRPFADMLLLTVGLQLGATLTMVCLILVIWAR